MGYKKYSSISTAEAMVENIRNGGISSRNTAFRELQTIVQEWEGTAVARDAEYLIDTRYSDLKFK